jgi:hypothetical protein
MVVQLRFDCVNKCGWVFESPSIAKFGCPKCFSEQPYIYEGEYKMIDLYTREERLGLPVTSIPSMVGQGLLFVSCLVMMGFTLLLLSV